MNNSALALILILATSSLIITQTASAMPKQMTPEFTVQYVDNSYDIPPNYTTDPYTGRNTTTNGSGEHIDERSVTFTIENQPFTPYTDASGNQIQLYYNFRFKGHYGDTWIYYPFNGTLTTHSYGAYSGGFFKPYPASTNTYTIFSIKLNTLLAHTYGNDIPSGSTLDFQVQAQIGHIDPIHSGMLAGNFYNFTGEASDWSSIQTVTIDKSIVSVPTPTISTPTPTEPASQNPNYPTARPIQPATQTDTLLSLDWRDIAIVLLAVVLGAVVLVMVFSRRKHAAAPST